jgi:hypothetical protein
MAQHRKLDERRQIVAVAIAIVACKVGFHLEARLDFLWGH